MKYIIVLSAVCFVFVHLHVQNMGVGTNLPQKKLSVRGSVLVDQSNTNYGSLDSAALLPGTQAGVGISSNKVEPYDNTNGIDFWTNGKKRLRIYKTGDVKIDSTLFVGEVVSGGRGITRSPVTPSVSTGFGKVSFAKNLTGGAYDDIYYCYNLFPNDGDNDRFRIMLGQFIPGVGSSGNVGCLSFMPIRVYGSSIPCNGGSQIVIRITNTCSTTVNTGIGATLYLYMVWNED